MSQERVIRREATDGEESWGTSYHDVSPDIRMWNTDRDNSYGQLWLFCFLWLPCVLCLPSLPAVQRLTILQLAGRQP